MKRKGAFLLSVAAPFAFHFTAVPKLTGTQLIHEHRCDFPSLTNKRKVARHK